MQYRLARRYETPPGGWWYEDPDTQMILSGPSLEALVSRVAEHRRINELPLSPTLAADVEHAICLRIDSSRRVPVHERTEALRLQKATSFTAVANQTIMVLKSAFARRPYLPPIPLDPAREQACMGCQFHVQDPGCYACYATQLFTPLVGKWPEPAERLLSTCAVDSTFIRATVHLADPAVFPQVLGYPEHCWKRVKPEPESPDA